MSTRAPAPVKARTGLGYDLPGEERPDRSPSDCLSALCAGCVRSGEEMTIHEEEVLGKAYDARLMRRLLRYLRPYSR